jgi:hypothetical protein
VTIDDWTQVGVGFIINFVDNLQSKLIVDFPILLPRDNMGEPEDPLHLDSLQRVIHHQEGLQSLEIVLHIVISRRVDHFDEYLGHFLAKLQVVLAHSRETQTELLASLALSEHYFQQIVLQE